MRIFAAAYPVRVLLYHMNSEHECSGCVETLFLTSQLVYASEHQRVKVGSDMLTLGIIYPETMYNHFMSPRFLHKGNDFN